MSKEKKVELTEKELQEKAQKIFQTKIDGANKEIAVILKKYGLNMIVDHTIRFVPTQQ